MKDGLEGLYQPQALARTSDPQTSKRAAARVRINPLEEKVLAVLAEHGPMDTKEIAEKAGVDRVSISPRMKPLETKGKIERVKVVDGSIKWGVKVDGQAT